MAVKLNMQKPEIQIVWFKRDLRITDHKPLFEASKILKPILPIYVVENEYYWQCYDDMVERVNRKRQWLQQERSNLERSY